MKIRSTTILGIIHNGEAAIGGDGQVTLGNTVMKHNSMKIRKLHLHYFNASKKNWKHTAAMLAVRL